MGSWIVTDNRELVCVGSYTAITGGRGVGISTFWRDPDSGELTALGELTLDSPSWLAWHPTVPVLYAANETPEGAVTAVALGAEGELTALNSLPTGGADPCHLAVTPDGRFLVCANYTGGSLAVFSLAPDGRLVDRTDLVSHHGSGPVAGRQESAHVHMVVPGTDGLISAVDLGTDEIRSYQLSAAGTLALLAVSGLRPGTGPRQLVRRPGSSFAYVVGELAGSLITVREEPAGTFTVVDSTTATTPDNSVNENLAAHLELTADGGLLLSNRGPDCLTYFSLADDRPVPVVDLPSGVGPRQFALSGGQCYVAAQHEDSVVVRSVPTDGFEASVEVGRTAVGSPTCVVVAPDYR
ncbi:MAG TPA: lactonase family protein [Pseudonocardiaceae bacterium]|jgi:6-phosphogluconolactonase (cycloisomerase 2 family)|nr:lactonase family protein [Pseudonocardiaceae bacterium]